MTFIEKKELPETHTGTLTFPPQKTKYTRKWRVTMSDKNDGPQTLLDQWDGPRIGFSYREGNDVDGSVRLTELTPVRDEPRTSWIVTGKWTPITDDEDKDEDGKDPEDPLGIAPGINETTAIHRVPVVGATLHTEIPGRAAGTFGPVVNSANVPFDPPLEKDESRGVIRFSLNVEKAQQVPVDVVNSDELVLDYPKLGYRRRIRKGFGKMTGASSTLKYHSSEIRSFYYWRVELEVVIRRGGWREQVVDRGFNALARNNKEDPDGNGGLITSDENGNPIILDGVPELRSLNDFLGNPINEPVLFDGKGQPLKEGEDPVFLEYQIYPEIPFRPFFVTT